MAQYYVILNKNTGLYFRGKGVNRWGKHYNQASIYRVKAMAEHTIKEVSWRGEQAEIVPIQIIETTADVVPKSELSIIGVQNMALENTNVDLKRRLVIAEAAASVAIGKASDMVSESNREVAREIFAEIEREIKNHGFSYAQRKIAELKKKYTEE